MKINKRLTRIAVLFFLVLAAAAQYYLFREQTDKVSPGISPDNIIRDTWSGYKRSFIDNDGRVMRVKEGDTVSEGQAYAMLRAVWMRDKETFDKCYRWSEQNLSRNGNSGDSLLAWRWENGKVVSWMPASDADIDYALSLVLAGRVWGQAAPPDLEDYLRKATQVLADILSLETYRTRGGRLYLSPWILGQEGASGKFPVNPSYYSPAHFRVFNAETGDKRWLDLAETTYFVLEALAAGFGDMEGKGLVPDWCAVDADDRFYPLEGKSAGFGWEAVRVPLRIAMDHLWFKAEKAKVFFDAGFTGFIETEWKKNNAVYCEYAYNGGSVDKYENPLFYAAYYCALSVSASPYADKMLGKTRVYLKDTESGVVYSGRDEYYINSLAWFAEGLFQGIIVNAEKR